MFNNFRFLPVDVQIALSRMNDEFHANYQPDPVDAAWLDEQLDAAHVAPLPNSFRFRTIADYTPPDPVTASDADAIDRYVKPWKPVEKPCLGITHHTVRED